MNIPFSRGCEPDLKLVASFTNDAKRRSCFAIALGILAKECETRWQKGYQSQPVDHKLVDESFLCRQMAERIASALWESAPQDKKRLGRLAHKASGYQYS